jgi:hypothetical protein
MPLATYIYWPDHISLQINNSIDSINFFFFRREGEGAWSSNAAAVSLYDVWHLSFDLVAPRRPVALLLVVVDVNLAETNNEAKWLRGR